MRACRVTTTLREQNKVRPIWDSMTMLRGSAQVVGRLQTIVGKELRFRTAASKRYSVSRREGKNIPKLPRRGLGGVDIHHERRKTILNSVMVNNKG